MNYLANFSEFMGLVVFCIWRIGVPLYNFIKLAVEKDKECFIILLLSILFPFFGYFCIGSIFNDSPKKKPPYDWELAELIAKEELEKIQRHLPYSSDISPIRKKFYIPMKPKFITRTIDPNLFFKYIYEE